MRMFLGGLLATCVVSMATAAPVLESVTPLAGQRGTEFTVTLTGGRLVEPQTLLFYQPGLTCVRLTATSDTETTATVRATADCPLGEHAFRLIAKNGISELRTLGITAFPVVAEVDADNNTPKTAQPVSLNRTIVGRIDTNDTDCYAVTLKKGQRLTAEVEAVRLGSPLDAVITIYGPDGQKLADVDDTAFARQDPVATITAAHDGVHVVTIRETGFGGGDAEVYALHVGTFLRPTALYPAGGPLGEATTVEHFGTTGPATVKPTDAAFRYFPSDAGGTAPTPNPFRVSPFGNVNEVEPNDTKPSNKPVAWPIAFNGIISQNGDIDEFAFTANEGDTLDVSVYALRLGSPVDTIVSVLDATGRVLASNDDDETHDSRVRFTAPRTATYGVRVLDKRKQGGPNFIYRVEVTKTASAVQVFLASPQRKTQDRGTIHIPRGNRVCAFLAVQRDLVSGPVTLDVSDLPKGVKLLVPVTIPADEYLVPVILEAAADAPLTGQLTTLTGRCGSTQGGFRQTITLVQGPGDLSLHDVTVTQLPVAVVAEVPFTVMLEKPAATLATDGSLTLKVQVQRQTDFTDAVEVSFPFVPPGVEAPGSVVIPATKTEATVTFNAQRKAELGTWPVFVEAKPTIATPKENPDAQPAKTEPKGRRPRRSFAGIPTVASNLITMPVTATPLTGTLVNIVAEQGKPTTVTVTLKGPLPAGFTATLAGLPPRVTSEAVPLTAKQEQITFKLNVAATAPLGTHTGIVCELTGTVQGQPVVYRVGRGATLTLFPEGGVRTDKDGKPLSRLEALRLEQQKKQP